MIRYLLIFTVFIGAQHSVSSLTTSDKAKTYGYPIKTYHYKTEDNALVGMERIPYGKRSNGTIGKPVILLPGVLASSITFVYKNTSLAFFLADAGYDVWLPNYRANGLSLKVKDPQTGKILKLSKMNWNYSFHELGIYDFPAAIDLVLKETGRDKVDVVGISLGTTISLIGLSEKPEYNNKIRNLVMMGPAAKMKNSLKIRPLQYVLAKLYAPMVITALSKFRYINVFQNPDKQLLGYLCRTILFRYQCVHAMTLLQGVFTPFKYDVVADLATTYPQPSSTKAMIHYIQLMMSGRFCNFDYGPDENVKHYKSQVVPEYNVSKITAPTILIYSKTDLVTPPSDVKWLFDKMPNIKDSYYIHKIPFSHQAFILGNNAHTVVYPYIARKLSEND
ncbi:lipase 3-like [Adelges cooleyi]|uniref:lipase 3-like n=1 Tax=Adelges cooleyi TaxID=133065 RepID=UPI002180772B|nr:lipase 3-like [Adelges cooleyi]